MSVEPVGLETIVLEGTDLAISSPFKMEVQREDGLRLNATVHVVDGRLVCRALELNTEHGDVRKLLHGLGLATLIRQAASRVSWRAVELAPGMRPWEESRFDIDVIRAEARQHLKLIPLLGPRQMTDAFLEQVAVAYRRALKDHEKTAPAVTRLNQSYFGYNTTASEATARRWIATARKRGFLEQTTKGRKGG